MISVTDAEAAAPRVYGATFLMTLWQHAGAVTPHHSSMPMLQPKSLEFVAPGACAPFDE